MSQSDIRLANDGRLASEQRGRGSLIVEYQEVAIANLGSQPLPLMKLFKNDSASPEMAVDGSTPINFDVTPTGSEIFRIERLVLVMSLSASPTMPQFGNLAVLANGLSLQVLDAADALIVDLLDGENIKSNNDLANFAKLDLHAFGATQTLVATFDLPSPARLEVPTAGAEKLRITVSDNLSTISSMRCLAAGRQEDIVT